MSSHPFLSLTGNPAWENLKPEHIREDITLALEKAEANLQQIRDLKPEEINFRNTVKALENASYELYYAWGLVTHLDSVCNSAELREVHNEMLPAVSTFGAKITLDAGLWKVLQIFAESKETSSLKPIDRRLLEETLLDFKEAGADLPNEKRQRLEEISQQLAQVTQKFSEQVLDATNEWKLIVREEDKLKGLPETAREAARQSAIEKLGEEEGKDAWVFTLHTPSMLPVLQYLEDDEIRKEVWSASDNLCVKAPYENEPLIREILKLRQEKAEILGKDNFADAVLARRMAKNGEKADQFVSELRDKTIPFFQQENQELEEFKAEKNGKPVDGLQPWEVGFWSEKLKKERYDFDDEDLRPYFPIQSVLSGMFELATRIFGLTIKEQPTQFQGKTIDNGLSTDASPQSVWHEEVRFYDLIDSQSGKHLGSFYADWHPRSSKRAGAWMNYFKTGEPSGNGEREPHLGLICGNLTAPTPTKPALLTHYEVETVFHEFGHLLHHLCGNVPHRSLNGVNVPWDFVELPSQIMENWCWERESLDLFARHHETNEAHPGRTFSEDAPGPKFHGRKYHDATTCIRQVRPPYPPGFGQGGI
jgi:oligopeptidase A